MAEVSWLLKVSDLLCISGCDVCIQTLEGSIGDADVSLMVAEARTRALDQYNGIDFSLDTLNNLINGNLVIRLVQEI